MRIFAPGPGKAGSAPGPANKASLWSRARRSPLRCTARRGALAFPMAAPVRRNPRTIAADVPRPPHWGGYRLYADAVELWVEGEFRIHDRARWTRVLA